MKGGRCTNCGNQLERGFGLVNCLQCGTLLFIDLEGQVEQAEANRAFEEMPPTPEAIANSKPPTITIPTDADDQNFESPFFQSELSEEPPPLPPQKSGSPKGSTKSQASPTKAQTPPPLKTKTRDSVKTRVEAPLPESDGGTEDTRLVVRLGTEETGSGQMFPTQSSKQGVAKTSSGTGSPLFQMPNLGGDDVGNESQEVFEDGPGAVDFLKDRTPEGEGLDSIKNFGNSDLSQGQDGSLFFDVIISGIDSKKIRDDLRDCLTDRRFLWDVDQLIKSIRKGELKLQGLSSVKASVVLSRLKELPVGLKWIQTGLTELKQRERSP